MTKISANNPRCAEGLGITGKPEDYLWNLADKVYCRRLNEAEIPLQNTKERVYDRILKLRREGKGLILEASLENPSEAQTDLLISSIPEVCNPEMYSCMYERKKDPAYAMIAQLFLDSRKDRWGVKHFPRKQIEARSAGGLDIAGKIDQINAAFAKAEVRMPFGTLLDVDGGLDYLSDTSLIEEFEKSSWIRMAVDNFEEEYDFGAPIPYRIPYQNLSLDIVPKKYASLYFRGVLEPKSGRNLLGPYYGKKRSENPDDDPCSVEAYLNIMGFEIMPKDEVYLSSDYLAPLKKVLGHILPRPKHL